MTDDTPSRPDVSTDDASTSRRTFLRTAATGALAVGFGNSVTGTAAARGIPTPRLHREGNKIVDPSGNEVTLRGVNVVDPARANNTFWRRPVPETVDHATDPERGWYSRIIRVPCQPGDIAGLNQGETAPPTFDGSQLESYLENHLDPVIQKCKEVGVYAIVDYHRHRTDDYTTDALDEEVRLFWETVAPRYAEDTHVLYEVFNEPIGPFHGESQAVDGSVLDDEAEETWLTWKETAQPWVHTIREHAPENVVIIGSPRWSQWTYWAPRHEFEGDNLAYAAHVYTHENLRPLGKYFGEPSTKVPVFMTEFGYQNKRHDGGKVPEFLKGTTDTAGKEFKDFFEEYESLHWQAWCFDHSWAPPMFDFDDSTHEWSLMGGQDWQGQFFKDLLAAKRDDSIPGTGTGSDQMVPSVGGLEATGTTPTTMSIQWGRTSIEIPADQRPVSYVVSVDGTEEKTVSQPEATITGLEPETSYEISVVAVNANGYRSDPATATISTPAGRTPPEPTVQVSLDAGQATAGESATASISLSAVPQGLAGYTLAVSLSNLSVATVESASYPDSFGMTEDPQIASDGSSVTLKAVDVEDEITAGANEIGLATVSLSAEATGQTDVAVGVEAMDDDSGGTIDPVTTSGTLSVTTLSEIDGTLPQDLDDDGLYEDLNANGRLDSDDVVVFFDHKSDAAVTDHTAAYDYNGNGRIDFDDVASLFGEL